MNKDKQKIERLTNCIETLRSAIETHIHELTKKYQPAPFMDGSRHVPPSIERLLVFLETTLEETSHGIH